MSLKRFLDEETSVVVGAFADTDLQINDQREGAQAGALRRAAQISVQSPAAVSAGRFACRRFAFSAGSTVCLNVVHSPLRALICSLDSR